MNLSEPAAADRSSFGDLFTPKLITALREGYDWEGFRADALAGLTVAIVALPLAMAIAIASGSTPDRGLYTAIVAGFLISAFGGSRFQIGGPTGAFVVLVHAVIQRHGFDGLVLATLLAGLMLLAVGYLRLGSHIRYIPQPVTTGFTAGIAVIIFTSQIPDLLGLALANPPADFLPKLAAVGGALGTISPATIAVSALSLGLIIGLRRWRPRWPGFLVAVGVGGLIVAGLGLDVDTIGSRFGGIPRGLPAPSLPDWSLARVATVFPDAIAIALLAGIESLLCAVVADKMTGRQHRSNCELVAQGGANIASALFEGLPATGAIARTATNIRSGARSPVAGMLHAVFLLLFMLIAAPLAAYIPLATLGAVLAVVAWNMSEAPHVAHLIRRAPAGDRLILVLTLLLTVLVDLTMAIQVGIVLAAIVFMHRMAETVEIKTELVLVEGPPLDMAGRPAYAGETPEAAGFVVYRINGPCFFGAASRLSAALDRITTPPRGYILDFSASPIIDATGAAALENFVAKALEKGETVILAAANPTVRRTLHRLGLQPPKVRFVSSMETALSPERAEGVGGV